MTSRRGPKSLCALTRAAKRFDPMY